MASFIWDRDTQEALDRPYEYNAHKQFHREGIKLCEQLLETLLEKKRFRLEDRSLEMATWMLQTDALYSFKEAIELLEGKRHRVVGRLLRDILETIHLIEYLNSGSAKAAKSLEAWFNDELVMHREYREFIKDRDGKDAAEYKKNLHRVFSKFTHRSYKILLYGYMLAGDDCIYYDHKWTLPQTVSMYYAFLGHFGTFIVENLKTFGFLSKDEVETIWRNSMEDFQMPRGYLSPEDKEFLGITDEEEQYP